MPHPFQSAALLGATAAIVGIAATAGMLLAPRSSIEASRLRIYEGDLYQAQGQHELRITESGDIRILFDESESLALYGERLREPLPGSEDNPGAILHVLRKDTGQTTKVSDTPVREAILDPSGDAAYFVALETSDLYQVRLNEHQEITLLSKKVLSPHPAGDGQRLIYQKLNSDWQPGQYFDRALGLTVLDTKTAEERRITDSWEDFGPLWSPDSAAIIFFSRNPEGIASMFAISPDGKERRQLTNHGHTTVRPDTVPIPSERPSWSADGMRLLYESDREIWLIELSPAKDRVIRAARLGYGRHPQWLPDGKAVTFFAAEPADGSPALLTVDLSGKIIR